MERLPDESPHQRDDIPHGGRQVWLSGDAHINSVRLRFA